MGVERKHLQGFISFIRHRWMDRMQRAAYCTVETLQPQDDGVQVQVSWQNRDGSAGDWSKLYPLEYFFGHTLQLSWEARAILRRPCDFTNDVIRDVLSHRGVL